MFPHFLSPQPAPRANSTRRKSVRVSHIQCPESLEPRLAFASASLVADIVPGADGMRGGGYGSSMPTVLTEFKNAVYFAASDASLARGIWRTDGTAAGTTVTAVIKPDRYAPGYSTDAISSLTVAGDYLFFREAAKVFDSYSVLDNSKIWRTDGTAAGTILLKDFGARSDVRHMTNVDGTLFFSVWFPNREELWRSDGTLTGTVRLGEFAEISPCTSFAFHSHLGSFAALGGDVYFGAIQTSFVHPWAPQPCSLVKWDARLQSFVTLQQDACPVAITSANGRILYGTGVRDVTGQEYGELWQTDGTAGGTARVARLSDPSDRISGIAQAGGRVLVATTPVRAGLPNRILNLSGNTLTPVYTSEPTRQSFLLRPWGNNFFVVENGFGTDYRFLRVGGPSLDVSLLGVFHNWGGAFSGAGYGDAVRSSYVAHPNGRLYFVASSTVPRTMLIGTLSMPVYDVGLWESDGTPGGTRFFDVTPDYGLAPQHLSILQGELFYSASSSQYGSELWKFQPAATVGPTVPSSPRGLSVTPGDGRVSLSWSAPGDSGGASVTDYIIQFRAVAAATWSTFGDGISTNTVATVPGLQNGTAYVFRVSAVNASGASVASTESPSAIPRTVPSPPTKVVVAPGEGSVSLSWSAPTDNGGASVTDYIIQFKAVADATWSTFGDEISTNTVATVPGLRNGKAYMFRVSAVNASGASVASTESPSAIPSTVPNSPRGLSVTPGDGRVSLSWSAPADNGGASVTDYIIQFRAVAAATWSTFGDGISTNTVVTVPGLQNSTAYVFRVSAVNASGTSAFSTVANGTTTASLGQQVASFLTSKLGTRVGGGECSHMAIEALRASGAEFIRWYESSPVAEFTQGSQVVGKRFQVGDIVQLDNASFSSGRFVRHHTQIVAAVDGNGRITQVFEQNVNGRRTVQRNTATNLSQLTGGTVAIYRPTTRIDQPRRLEFTVVNNTNTVQTYTRQIGSFTAAATLDRANTVGSYKFYWSTIPAGASASLMINGSSVAIRNATAYELYTTASGQAAIRALER